MQAELRRHRDMLAMSGLAVLVFDLWGILRSALISIFGTSTSASDSAKLVALIESLDENVVVVGFVALLAIGIVDFVLTIIVGLSAISEGRGRRKGYAYVVFAGLSCIRCIFTIALAVFLIRYTPSLISNLSSIILDASMLLALVEIVRSSIRAKRLLRDDAAGTGAMVGEV